MPLVVRCVHLQRNEPLFNPLARETGAAFLEMLGTISLTACIRDVSAWF